MGKKDAEELASDSVREDENLSWREWSGRLDEYFLMVEALFSPDLFIVGGGISKKADKFLPRSGPPRPRSCRAAAERGRDRRRRARARPARRRAPHRLTPTRVLRRRGHRRAPREPGVGPVPPLDRVLAVEPAQQVGLARRRERGKSMSPRPGSRTMMPSAWSSPIRRRDLRVEARALTRSRSVAPRRARGSAAPCRARRAARRWLPRGSSGAPQRP